MIDAKLCIFGGQSSKNYFLMDEKKNMALANENREQEVKDSNPLIQRYTPDISRTPLPDRSEIGGRMGAAKLPNYK